MSENEDFRLENIWTQTRHLPWTLRLVWHAGPKLCVAWIALILLRGLLPIATVYAVRGFVTALEQHFEDPTGGLTNIVVPAILLGMTLVTGEFLASLALVLNDIQSERLQDHISGLVHRQTGQLDLSFFEDASFHDKLHRAVEESSYRPQLLIGNLSALMQHGITLLSMGTILTQYSIWLPLALFVGTIPAFFTVLVHGIRRHRWKHHVTELRREAWYYDWLLTGREAAPEIRLFNLSESFRERFNEIRRKLRSQSQRLSMLESCSRLITTAIGLLFAALVAVWAIREVRLQPQSGIGPLAQLAFFFQAFRQGQQMVRSLLRQAGELYANNLYLGDLRDFLKLQPKIVDSRKSLAVGEAPPSIRFENVSYSYPDGTDVFSNLNLEIQSGEFVALVGPNGTGKSTILKLLCRLYDPTNGSIQWEGEDLRNYSLEDLRRRIAVLFQAPMHYNATVFENIALERAISETDHTALQTDVRKFAAAAGIDEVIERQRHGYEQMLGYWFEEGTDLSDGEWQRIGLARACFRRCPLIILDEPTSAIDPWAEYQWTERFRRKKCQTRPPSSSSPIASRRLATQTESASSTMDESRSLEHMKSYFEITGFMRARGESSALLYGRLPASMRVDHDQPASAPSNHLSIRRMTVGLTMIQRTSFRNRS